MRYQLDFSNVLHLDAVVSNPRPGGAVCLIEIGDCSDPEDQGHAKGDLQRNLGGARAEDYLSEMGPG